MTNFPAIWDLYSISNTGAEMNRMCSDLVGLGVGMLSPSARAPGLTAGNRAPELSSRHPVVVIASSCLTFRGTSGTKLFTPSCK